MKHFRLLAAAAIIVPAPALAQHEGHSMPAPAPAAVPAPAPVTAPAPADDGQMDHSQHHPAPAQDAQSQANQPAVDHSTMDHSQIDHAVEGEEITTEGPMRMRGALGAYAMGREASGTAWQPDSSRHDGIHEMVGDWTLMAHGNVDLVHSWQEGPRGDSKTFAAGMLMGMARRSVGNGTLQLRAMLSPDPLMGKSGYPILLASGETADGVEHLVDRQHPHDFFMELSASLSQQIDADSSVFIYGGLPGEPAFGPPAFMHRQSISVSPEAPISHHWLDSTHITFGVVTAGLVHKGFKIEASRFNAREPDQYRWNIETGPLNSTSVRISLNPTRTLALQASWGHFKEPEQLEPGVNQKRLSASGTWTVPLSEDAWMSSTLAWGRKSAEDHKDDAFALESSVGWKNWTLFGRAERVENRELVETPDHRAFTFKKASLGAYYELPVAKHLAVGAGALYAFNWVPKAVEPLYGGDPNGAMGFVRLRIR